MTFKERLCKIDNGRFKKLIEVLDVKDVCEDCFSFNEDHRNSYMCGVVPLCIGRTLSYDLKRYILWTLYDEEDKEEYERKLKENYDS